MNNEEEVNIENINKDNNKDNNLQIKRKSILKNKTISLRNMNNKINNYNNIKEISKNNNESDKNIYLNSKEIRDDINLNLDDSNVKKEKKKQYIKNENLFEDKMETIIIEKLKNLKEQKENKWKAKENNEFKKLQNEINELKNLLNKIYNLKVNQNLEEKNEMIQDKRYHFKYKTINNGKIVTKDKREVLIPLIRNKTFKNNERKQIPKGLKLTKRFKINSNINEQINLNGLSFDNLVLLKLKNKQNNNIENNKNNNYNDEDSLIYFSDSENMKNKPLEELSPEINKKNYFLINLLGEEIIQKIFSKNIYYKEEGFNYLNSRVKDIINFSPENTKETNECIISLINIFFSFIDDKHPSIVMKCLELLMNIVISIEEMSTLNNIEYVFKITKPIIKKIISKLNHNSRRIQQKALELYFYLLDSKLCNYNSLIIELIENEVNEFFYKLNILKNDNLDLRKTNSRAMISQDFHNPKKINKNLVLTKMNIFLKIFSDQENSYKFDIKKFPENIVGDYIIMNINNPKEEIRQITKNVLVKYIHIFGNQIFYKLKMIIGNKDLLKIIQDNQELKLELKKYEEEKNKRDNDAKLLLNKIKINKTKLKPLSPLRYGTNINYNNFSPKNNYKLQKINIDSNRNLIRASSLPKFISNKKAKLKPINGHNFYINDSTLNTNINSPIKRINYIKKNTYNTNISNN